ncbi:hypothetical protein [Selenomonas flueggei]|uniref:hypothetical protein n=1 Tax=Selenomonas flueggei TaxID=135080 RepID=UPI0026727BAE|nr:hypothetical protein [Selenomonas flueggei]
MLKKLFLPSLVLVSILAFSCALVHAEEPPARSMLIKVDPNAPRTKGSPVVVESSLEIERTTLHDRGTALTMYLPPMERTFNSFSARTGETIFINDSFSNGDAPLHLEALIAHTPTAADTSARTVPIPGFGMLTGAPAQGEAAKARFKEACDQLIASLQAAADIKDVEVLSNEEVSQNGHPAHRLTVRLSTNKGERISDMMWVSEPAGEWFIHLFFDADNKDLTNHAHYLFSSIEISADRGK